MIRIKYGPAFGKDAIRSWERALAKHPEGTVSGLTVNRRGYTYDIRLPMRYLIHYEVGKAPHSTVCDEL